MSKIVNRKGLSNARSLIKQKKINSSDGWSFSTQDENRILGDNNWNEYSRWFLAEDTKFNKETKQRYKYPFGKNGKVYRSAIIAIRQRAGQFGDRTIFQQAGTLLNLIDKKEVQALRINMKAINAFYSNDIIDIIGSKKYNEILEKDKHPYFKMFVLAQEGDSNPDIIGEENKKIVWTKKAIKSINALKIIGINAYRNHKKKKKEYRGEIGKTVGNKEMIVDNKLSHVVVIYHPQKYQEEAKSYNICSQESILTLFKKAGHYIADKVHQITAIVESNSSVEKAGLPGAVQLAELQALNKAGDANFVGETNEGANMNYDEWLKVGKFDWISQAIKDLNVRPNQIFSKNDLEDDKEFKIIFDENKVTQTELQSTKENNEKLELETKELKRKILLSDSKERLQKILKDNKYTDKQQKFILKQDISNNIDVEDEGLKNFAIKQAKILSDALEFEDIENSSSLFSNEDDGNEKNELLEE